MRCLNAVRVNRYIIFFDSLNTKYIEYLFTLLYAYNEITSSN
jgi:hypothetical protein